MLIAPKAKTAEKLNPKCLNALGILKEDYSGLEAKKPLSSQTPLGGARQGKRDKETEKDVYCRVQVKRDRPATGEVATKGSVARTGWQTQDFESDLGLLLKL